MRLLVLLLVLMPTLAGQTPVTVTPPYPRGMRVIVGEGGSIPRNAPATGGTCGADNHPCSSADAMPVGTYAVIDDVAPVLDAAGGTFYWQRTTYATGAQGWSRGLPPFLNALTPPQMVSGIPFYVVASYGPGPILTEARCINDGLNQPAAMQLTNTTCCSDNGPGQVGQLVCSWPKAGIANHTVVIIATNAKGSTPSLEFQFAVTAAPIAQGPSIPSNMRIAK